MSWIQYFLFYLHMSKYQISLSPQYLWCDVWGDEFYGITIHQVRFWCTLFSFWNKISGDHLNVNISSYDNHYRDYHYKDTYVYNGNPKLETGRGWVGLWGFLWWAPSAKRVDHHGVSSGWSSVWLRSNTGLSSTQYEQIPIILRVWPFWVTPFFFWSITFWRAYV